MGSMACGCLVCLCCMCRVGGRKSSQHVVLSLVASRVASRHTQQSALLSPTKNGTNGRAQRTQQRPPARCGSLPLPSVPRINIHRPPSIESIPDRSGASHAAAASALESGMGSMCARLSIGRHHPSSGMDQGHARVVVPKCMHVHTHAWRPPSPPLPRPHRSIPKCSYPPHHRLMHTHTTPDRKGQGGRRLFLLRGRTRLQG